MPSKDLHSLYQQNKSRVRLLLLWGYLNYPPCSFCLFLLIMLPPTLWTLEPGPHQHWPQYQPQPAVHEEWPNTADDVEMVPGDHRALRRVRVCGLCLFDIAALCSSTDRCRHNGYCIRGPQREGLSSGPGFLHHPWVAWWRLQNKGLGQI